jgi:hypothetical protein
MIIVIIWNGTRERGKDQHRGLKLKRLGLVRKPLPVVLHRNENRTSAITTFTMHHMLSPLWALYRSLRTPRRPASRSVMFFPPASSLDPFAFRIFRVCI